MELQNNIAQNVKEIRQSRGLTLEEAAKLTGVSKSMLSQIEKGDVNPTISVIWKIANGYKVSFSMIMEDHNQKSEVIRFSDITPVIEGENGYFNYPIFPFQDGRQFETYMIKISPNGSLDAQPHLIGTEEYITVFSGSVQVSVGEECFELSTGDSIHFKADVNHSYRNSGSDEAMLSMMLYYN